MMYRIKFKEEKDSKKETKVTFKDYQKAMKEGENLINELFGDILKATERFD